MKRTSGLFPPLCNMVAFTVNPNFAGQDESTHQTLGNSNVKVNSIGTVSFLGNVHASGTWNCSPTLLGPLHQVGKRS